MVARTASIRRAWARAAPATTSIGASSSTCPPLNQGQPLRFSLRRRMRALPLSKVLNIPNGSMKGIDTAKIAACCPLGVDMIEKRKDYGVLAKSKLTTFVAISALPGYIIAAPVIDPTVAACLFVGTFLYD